MLTHLIPPVAGGILEGPFLDGARRRFNGPLSIGEDGDLISLPAGGRTTRKKNVLSAAGRRLRPLISFGLG